LHRFELSLLADHHKFERLQLQQHLQRQQKHLQEQKRFLDARWLLCFSFHPQVVHLADIFSRAEELRKFADTTWFTKNTLLTETKRKILEKITKKEITHVNEATIRENFNKMLARWKEDHEVGLLTVVEIRHLYQMRTSSSPGYLHSAQ